MYAIMGVTGQIGSVIGRALLAAEQPIRAVVRDAGKAQVWADRGCEIALANIEDTASLTTAFRGVEGIFVLVPPNFDPAPEFPEARAIAAALRTALEAARPARVVYLSTIGAQASQSNLAHPTHDHRSDPQRIADADHVPASGLVHGELQLGCSSGARARCDSKLSATARQGGADGGHGGHREGGSRIASGNVERPPRGGARRTATRDAERHWRNFRETPWPFGANASCATRSLGRRSSSRRV